MTNKKFCEVWLRIAKAYGTPYDQRTVRQKFLTDYGLCNSVELCTSTIVEQAFLIKIMKIFSGTETYWFPIRENDYFMSVDISKYDNYRCLIACFFLAMGYENFKELGE